MAASGFPVRTRVDFIVLTDRTPEFEAAVKEALEEMSRAGAQETLIIAEERVDSGNVPGPALKAVTIKRKAAKLAEQGVSGDPSKKWELFGIAVKEPTVITERTSESRAKAEIVTPEPSIPGEERPWKLFRMLEHGGVNGEGGYVPPRPLFTEILSREGGDLARIIRRVERVFKERVP